MHRQNQICRLSAVADGSCQLLSPRRSSSRGSVLSPSLSSILEEIGGDAGTSASQEKTVHSAAEFERHSALFGPSSLKIEYG